MIDALNIVTAVLDLLVLVRLLGRRFAPAVRWFGSTALGCACESASLAVEGARLDIADRRLLRQLRGRR